MSQVIQYSVAGANTGRAGSLSAGPQLADTSDNIMKQTIMCDNKRVGRMVPPLGMLARSEQWSLFANVRVPARGPELALCASTKKTQALVINANAYVFLSTSKRDVNAIRAKQKGRKRPGVRCGHYFMALPGQPATDALLPGSKNSPVGPALRWAM
jgi:hypothetical protein